MTDAEIIKALECHSLCTVSKCEECPLFPTNECSAELSGYALDLINRYKTKNEQLDNAIQLLESEIERRKNNLFCKVVIDEETMRSIINDKMAEFELDIKSIKAEAIKEFAEAFKVKFAKERYRDNYVIDDEMLDNLVKEMEKNKGYTEYAVEVYNNNGFVRQIDVFDTYLKAVEFAENYNEELSADEHLNITYIVYDENENEIDMGTELEMVGEG